MTGWAKNQSGLYKIEKKRLIQLVNELDLKIESIIPDASDQTVKSEVGQKVCHLLRPEEIKWALKAKVTKVVQGDDNTQFFHMIANGKHRMRKIVQLEQDEGIIIGHKNLILYISNFYKKLFRAPQVNSVSLDERVVEDIAQLSVDEKEVLAASFTENKVFGTVMQMK